MKKLPFLMLIVLALCLSARARVRTDALELPAELYGLELNWYVHFDGYNDPGSTTINATVEWIRDVLGVRVNYIHSANQADKTLAKMIATGDMPDIITLARGAQLDHLISQGWVVPLDSYYHQYPNFRRWADEATINALRSSLDGKWYGFPSWYTDAAHPLGNAGWIVGRKYYEEFGRPALRTTQDLLDYLRAVQSRYPLSRPFSPGPSLDVLYTSFGDERSYMLAMRKMWCDGSAIRPLIDDPAWRDMTLFLNLLYRENLLAVDEFYLTYQQIAEKLSTGQIIVMATSDALNGTMAHDIASRLLDARNGYEVIYPPVAPGVTKPTPASYEYAGGQTVTVITTAAAQPKLAYAFLDWLAGETGCAVTTCGPPGIYWNELIEFMGVMIPDTNTDAYLNRDIGQWLRVTSAIQSNYVPNGAWAWIESVYRDSLTPIKPDDWDPQRYAAITRSTAIITDEFAEIEPSNGVEGYDDYVKMCDYMSRMTLNAILAPSDAECLRILEQARAGVYEMGADTLYSKITNAWHSRRVKLGLE